MAEPYEYLRESAQNNDNERTGQEWHAWITSTYQVPLKAATFAPFVRDGHGNADWLSCHLMEWILDWFRPTDDGRPRVQGGQLDFPSAWLAANEFYVTPAKLKYARMTLSRLGFVEFHSQRHSCWVEVNWESIASVAKSYVEECRKLQDDGEFRQSNNAPSKSRQSNNAPSKQLRQSNNAPSNGLDGATMLHKPPLPSSPISSSLKGGQEEDVEKSGEGDARRPSAGVDENPSGQWGDTELIAMANELIEYGIKSGRQCSGPWAKQSQAAFADVVRDGGHDPTIVGAAWRTYLATFGDDAKRASDLGHWLRSVDLKDRQIDYGEQSFQALYDRAAAEARREDERRRVAAGGVPTPRFTHTSAGWAVSAEGVPTPQYGAVAPDATLAEAEAAWAGWWLNLQNSR